MCLRVETLLKRLGYFAALKGDWSAYSALLTILELTALLERGDEVIGVDNLNDYYEVQLKYDRLKLISNLKMGNCVL